MRTLTEPDALGVGLAFNSLLEPVIKDQPDLVDVIEIEPQTLWTPRKGGELKMDWDTLKRWRDYGTPILLHSVNNAVGGTSLPDEQQARLLADLANEVHAPWVSEHLSFNHVDREDRKQFTGFMLPALQSKEGVGSASRSILHLKSFLQTPLAVETGVNYFKPNSGELEDGDFVAKVVESADCGILLDLHNIWTNDRNGRQSVERFLSQIPLERVWEIHLAGGFEQNGYWLDSHSGQVPDDVMGIARDIVAECPNLGAIIFELFPVYVQNLGAVGVCRELERIQEVWSLRSDRPAFVEARTPSSSAAEKWPSAKSRVPTPAQWEQSLYQSIRGKQIHSTTLDLVGNDPAIHLVSELIFGFRSAMVVQNLHLSSNLLMLSLGPDAYKALLSAYCADVEPSDYAFQEARNFVSYLHSDEKLVRGVPFLEDVVRFESASLDTLLDDITRVVSFGWDPLVLLRSLADRRIPSSIARGHFEIEVTGDLKPL